MYRLRLLAFFCFEKILRSVGDVFLGIRDIGKCRRCVSCACAQETSSGVASEKSKCTAFLCFRSAPTMTELFEFASPYESTKNYLKNDLAVILNNSWWSVGDSNS